MEILNILGELDIYIETWKQINIDLNVNWYTPIYMAEASTKDEFYDYVLFFGGDIKREIHLWLDDDNFKTLLY